MDRFLTPTSPRSPVAERLRSSGLSLHFDILLICKCDPGLTPPIFPNRTADLFWGRIAGVAALSDDSFIAEEREQPP